MKKHLDFCAKSALLLTLAFPLGGCRAVLNQFAPPPTATPTNGGTPNFSVNIPPPGMTPSAMKMPASRAITSGGVSLEKIVLPKTSAPQDAQIAAATARAEAWAKKMRADSFPDADSGPGLIVGEPVVQGASTRGAFKAADFSAGCARWIFFQVGGRGELGKTPLWGGIDDARQGNGLRDLKMNAAQAAQMAASLGVTHVAIGTFSGDEKSGALSYQLLKMPEKSPVGAPFVVRGNAAQIVAGLPKMASQIAARLNAKTDGIAAKVGVDAAQLAHLGALPWKSIKPLDEAATEKLRVLALREPLAALLYLRDGDTFWGDPRRRAVLQSAMRAAPSNALLLADFMRATPGEMRREYSRIDAGLAKYPANNLLNFADLRRWQFLGDIKKQRVAAESLISCAPGNPLSWAALCDTLGDIAQELRRSRYSSDLSEKESGFLDQLYDMRLLASLHATKLSPSAALWSNVAEAATFTGDSEIADAALWKALSGNRLLLEAYRWGCEMYQSKWGGDADRARLLIKMIYADTDLTRLLWDDAGDLLLGLDLQNEAMNQLLYTVSNFESELQKNPDNAKVHLAWALLARDKGHDGSKDDIAIREFEKAIALLPNDPVPMQKLGEMLHFKKRRYRQAEALYRRALKLNPDYPDALKTLGNLTYYVHRDAAGAEKLYRRAIELHESGLYRSELARLLLDQGRKAEAVAQTKLAIADGFTRGSEIFARLGIDGPAEYQKVLAKRDEKIFRF